VKSRTAPRFWTALSKLPDRVRRDVRAAYRQFTEDPRHPSLDFKLVNPKRRTYSVRIGIHYRALGLREGDEITWYWVGKHDEYERLIP
jgi:mRNA-degrading endonuclease RelE of RelBE toxin-antitoxin system